MSYKIYSGANVVDLPKEWWVGLSVQLAGADGILATRSHYRVLSDMYRQGRSAVACDEDGIIGHATAWYTDFDLYEIGTVWVDPDHRGRRLIDRLVTKCAQELPPFVKTLFMVVHEPAMSIAARRLGWHAIYSKAWTRDVDWIDSCGTCRRQAEELKVHCPMRAVAGECQIFIKRR